MMEIKRDREDKCLSVETETGDGAKKYSNPCGRKLICFLGTHTQKLCMMKFNEFDHEWLTEPFLAHSALERFGTNYGQFTIY